MHLINSERFSFFDILENKLSIDHTDIFMAKVDNKWKHWHNIFNNLISRILIIWDSSQWLNIIVHSSDQFITCIFHIANGTRILCTWSMLLAKRQSERNYGIILLISQKKLISCWLWQEISSLFCRLKRELMMVVIIRWATKILLTTLFLLI